MARFDRPVLSAVEGLIANCTCHDLFSLFADVQLPITLW